MGFFDKRSGVPVAGYRKPGHDFTEELQSVFHPWGADAYGFVIRLFSEIKRCGKDLCFARERLRCRDSEEGLKF